MVIIKYYALDITVYAALLHHWELTAASKRRRDVKTGRGGSDVATSQATSGHQKTEKARNELPLHLTGAAALPTPRF